MLEFSIVENPTRDITQSLKRLANNRCCYPGCENEASTVVAILKNKKENPCFENSLILCENHALDCKQKKIKGDTLLRIRELLRVGRCLSETQDKCELPTRAKYLERIAEEIPKSKSVRCMYVGPLPFHPEWYFQLMEGKTRMKSMDAAVAKALANPNVSVKIIIRNDERYLEKCKSDIPDSLKRELVKETCENFEHLCLPKLGNSIEIWNPGIYHIPIILDECCIFAFRTQPNTPIEGGFLTTDKKQIKWERDSFDQMIACNKDKMGDIALLRTFLERMLS